MTSIIASAIKCVYAFELPNLVNEIQTLEKDFENQLHASIRKGERRRSFLESEDIRRLKAYVLLQLSSKYTLECLPRRIICPITSFTALLLGWSRHGTLQKAMSDEDKRAKDGALNTYYEEYTLGKKLLSVWDSRLKCS